MDKEKKSGLFKKEVKISSYFAFLTSVLIAVIVILTMGYVLRFVKNISYDYIHHWPSSYQLHILY